MPIEEIEGVSLPNLTEDGNTIMAGTFGFQPSSPTWRGFQHVFTLGICEFYDILLDRDRKLKSGDYHIFDESAIHCDDIMNFTYIDKDDTLGLFATYGLTVGEDILELHKFVDNIRPRKQGSFGVETWGVSDLLEGLYLRVSYDSNGTSNVDFDCIFTWFE